MIDLMGEGVCKEWCLMVCMPKPGGGLANRIQNYFLQQQGEPEVLKVVN